MINRSGETTEGTGCEDFFDSLQEIGRQKRMLSHCRVLDLTTERIGLLCGQVLGDLGADVIQVEPVGGLPVRQLPPFFADQPGPERSVYWVGLQSAINAASH